MRLAEAPPLTLAEITAVALALARQVDVLHRDDVVHGHIRPSRVTFTADGAALDPPDGAGFSKPHDVRSTGELTLWLLSRSGHRATGPLADVARAAAALDPGSRPTAAQLVEDLERVAALSEAPVANITPETRRKLLLLKVPLAAASVVLVIAVASVAWSRTPTNVEPIPAEPPAPARVTAAPRASTPLPAQVWPLERNQLSGPTGVVEVIGVGSPHHVSGDWHCGGTATLATLDTVTGNVFVFPGWAQRGEDVQAVAVAHVRGATSLASGDADGDGCADLRAVTPAGEVSIRVPVGAQP